MTTILGFIIVLIMIYGSLGILFACLLDNENDIQFERIRKIRKAFYPNKIKFDKKKVKNVQ